VFNPRKQVFDLSTSVGVPAESESAGRKLAEVRLDVDALAQGKPILIEQMLDDPRVPDQAWVRKESLAALAAYPLLLEDKLVGLMALVTGHPLTKQICQEMGSVANGIALCIER